MLNLAEVPDGDANQVQESTRLPAFECLQRGDIKVVFFFARCRRCWYRAEVYRNLVET